MVTRRGREIGNSVGGHREVGGGLQVGGLPGVLVACLASDSSGSLHPSWRLVLRDKEGKGY